MVKAKVNSTSIWVSRHMLSFNSTKLAPNDDTYWFMFGIWWHWAVLLGFLSMVGIAILCFIIHVISLLRRAYYFITGRGPKPVVTSPKESETTGGSPVATSSGASSSTTASSILRKVPKVWPVVPLPTMPPGSGPIKSPQSMPMDKIKQFLKTSLESCFEYLFSDGALNMQADSELFLVVLLTTFLQMLALYKSTRSVVGSKQLEPKLISQLQAALDMKSSLAQSRLRYFVKVVLRAVPEFLVTDLALEQVHQKYKERFALFFKTILQFKADSSSGGPKTPEPEFATQQVFLPPEVASLFQKAQYRIGTLNHGTGKDAQKLIGTTIVEPADGLVRAYLYMMSHVPADLQADAVTRFFARIQDTEYQPTAVAAMLAIVWRRYFAIQALADSIREKGNYASKQVAALELAFMGGIMQMDK